MPDQHGPPVHAANWAHIQRARRIAIRVQRLFVAWGLLLLLAGTYHWRHGNPGLIGYVLLLLAFIGAAIWAIRKPVTAVTAQAIDQDSL